MSLQGAQLRFGDCVVVHGSQDRKNLLDDKQQAGIRGLMTCQGFGQDSVYLESFQVNLLDENEARVVTIKNYRDCVFQIWPKLDFEAHKEFKKLNKSKAQIERQKQLQDGDDEEDPEVKQHQEQYYQDVIDKLKKVRQRCDVERSSNYNQIDQAKGKAVTYGQECFIMHVDSGQFLNGQVSCSTSDQSAYKFELSNIFNKGMIFRIVPRYKLRQEGETIQYKDNVLLLNTKLNCYVNFNSQTVIPLDKPLPPLGKPYYRKIDIQRPENRQRYECFVSNLTECTWQLLYFRSLPDKELYDIMGHELLYLRHTETQGLLSADFNYKADKEATECYVRNYTGSTEEEQFSIFSIWEVEMPANYARGEELVLQTKTTNPKTGQVTMESNRFLLRHFLTGKVLCCQEVTIDGQKRMIPCLSSDDKQLNPKSCHIQFISTSGDEKELMENNICYVMAINNLQISVSQELQYTIPDGPPKKDGAPVHYNKFSEVPDSEIYTPLKNSELDTIRYSTLCEDRGTQEENAFQVIRVESEAQKDILIVASQVSILQRFVGLVKAKQPEVRTSKDLIKQVQKAIAFLIFFVSKSSLEPTTENALQSQGVPLPLRQRIVRDFRLIELLMDLIYYPFKYEIVLIDNLKDVDTEFIKIFLLAYKCVMMSIKEYRPNELYASQWLSLMIRQAKMTVDDGDIGAEETLTELIDNNRRILETKISQGTIKQFMEMLLEEKADKYVQMVYALCVCNNSPMIFNQAEVSTLLLLNEQTCNQLVYPIIEEGGQIKVSVMGEVIILKEFRGISEERDSGKDYNFFLEMLTLCGGLCLGRNYLAIDVLTKTYPLGLCHRIMSSNEYDLGLRKKLSRLVIHLWVDRAPHTKIVLPDRIRIWSEIEKRDDTSIPSAQHDFSQLQQFKSFVLTELTLESQRGYSRMYETERNSFMLEVLNLLMMMMDFGFYMSTDEINQVMEPLLKLLKGVYDVSNEEEEVFIKGQIKGDDRRNNKRQSFAVTATRKGLMRLTTRYEDSDTNIIMHKTKRTICQILNHIVRIRDSTRLSYILLQFKEDTMKIQQMQQVGRRKSKVVPEAKSVGEDQGQFVDAIDFAKLPITWIDLLIQQARIKFDDQKDLTLILLDLTLYRYDELVNMSFELIHSQFSERQSMVTTVRQVQLLEDQQQIEVFHQLQEISVHLGELIEKSEQWLWRDDQAAQTLKVIENLEIIAGTLVIQNKERIYNDEPDGEILPLDEMGYASRNKFAQTQSSQLFSEGETSNAFTQDLIRNIRIYQDVVALLRFDAEQFTYRRSRGDLTLLDPKSPSHRAIRLCYLILGRFCYLCPENQELIVDNIEDVFMKHLKYMPNVGQHVMLEPFLYDNRNVLHYADVLGKVLTQLVQTINALPMNDGLKPSYFKCLMALTKNKGKVLKVNQTMIMNEITHRDYPNILVTYQEDFPSFQKEVELFQQQIDGNQQSVQVPSKLDYFNGFMYLMAIICEDKNNATESKTQNYFPLAHFFKLIEVSTNCWYVMKNLMFFFYHVYLDTEREMNEELVDVKRHLIQTMKTHLEQLAQTLNSQPGSIINFRGVLTLREVKEDYYFNSLLLCVETIIKRRMIDDFEFREQFHESLIGSLVQISRLLEPSERKYKTIVKNAFALLISVNAINDEDLKVKVSKEYVPTAALVTQVKRGQSTIHSFTKESRQNYMSIHAEKLRSRFEIVTRREDFRLQQKLEMDELIEKISQIEDISKRAFKGACTIPFEEIVRSMIDFTQKNAKVDAELTVLRLQIFQKIIERQNQATEKSILEWESDDYDQFKLQVVKAQNQMVELGIVKMLYALMMDEQQPKKIMEGAIHLSIALLLGGNKATQDAFYAEMTADNTNSLFVRLKDRLERGFDQVKKTMNIFNKKLFDQLVQTNNDVVDLNQQLDIEDQELEKLEEDLVVETIEEEDIDSMQSVIRILRLLQLFCEGHNRTMQDYLRHQVIENQVLGRNHDFVYNAAVQFSTYVKFVNVHSLDLGNQLVDFIMECVQGPCEGNQQKLVGAKIIDTCKDLMQKFQTKGDFEQYGFQGQDEVQGIQNLITKSTKLLLALIEGKANKFILESMAQSLDFDLLLERLREQYEYFKVEKMIKAEIPEEVFGQAGDLFEKSMVDTFSIFILLKQLESSSQYLKDTMEHLLSPDSEEGILSEAVKFFAYATKSVEVLFQEELIRVYFPLQPICLLLSKNTRSRLMTEIPRDSPNEKIEGLAEEAEGCFDEMEHMAYLQSLWFNFSQERLNLLRDLSTLVAFVINFFIILTYHKELDPDNYTQSINSTERFGIPTRTVMTYLGYIQLVTSCLMLVFWIFIHSPLLLTLKWRNFIQQNQKEALDELYLLDKYEDNDDIEPDDLPVSLTVKLLYLKGPNIPLFNRGIFKDFGNNYTLLMFFWKNFTFIFGDGNVKYFFFYITVSFVGNFVSEIVFSLHLLDVIDRFPTLQNVIKAITTNSRQLILTSLLGLIFMYIWAIVGFFFLDDNFNMGVYDVNGDELSENQCTTLLQCFVVTANHGLIMGGGVGDFLAVQSFTSDNAARYGVRYVYDLAFFMLVKMAFLNIIFGIIIDTFADLRDKRNTIEEDMKNVCFICGIERDEFDQFADGFENHIERDHHLWNYLYYLYHLRITDDTEYNGIESYVADKYESHDQSWFPLLKAMSIQKDAQEDDEAKLNIELETIKKAIRDVTISVERIQKQV